MVNGAYGQTAADFYRRPPVSALGQRGGQTPLPPPAQLPGNTPSVQPETPSMPSNDDLVFAVVQEMRMKRRLPLTPVDQERYDKIAAQVKAVMATQPAQQAAPAGVAAQAPQAPAASPEAKAINGLSKEQVSWALEFEKKATASGATTKEQLYQNFPKEEVDKYLAIAERIQQKPTFITKLKDGARNAWDKIKSLFGGKK